jgi:hypothetical protein
LAVGTGADPKAMDRSNEINIDKLVASRTMFNAAMADAPIFGSTPDTGLPIGLTPESKIGA